MKLFADSSALVKHYIEEKGSERVARVLRKASALGLSVLCQAEVLSAFNRRRRAGDLTTEDYRTVKKALLDDLSDAEIVHLTPEVLRLTTDLLEKHELRALDALHLGSALVWRAESFLSADRNQLRAAASSGLKILQV